MTTTLRYDIAALTPYINWLYFFHAWGMPPRFASVSAVHDCAGCRSAWLAGFAQADRAQAKEAERLYRDAKRLLSELQERCAARAAVGLFPAWSVGDDIMIRRGTGEAAGVGRVLRLPFLRQQRAEKAGGPCLCLADFVSPHQPPLGVQADALPVENVLGAFAVAVAPPEGEETADDYRRMLLQTLLDRLAEAAAERLHEQVRHGLWGYAPSERLTPQQLFAERYQGRRPAVGYPSMPDQSFMFVLAEALPLEGIGVTLTENGMMRPHAAAAGLMFGHPAARHFAVGAIDEAQLEDYARRRGLQPAALRKFLSRNLQ